MERRKHARIPKRYYFIYYERPGVKCQCDMSGLLDISQGGMCFVAGKQFSLSALIEFELHIPYFMPVPINLNGKVVDVKRRLSTPLYETRVKFTGLSELAKGALELIEMKNI